MAKEEQLKINTANIGLNLNSQIDQIKPGQLTFAMNAQLANFDGNQVSYQNEQSNELCTNFPSGYKVIGHRNIVERGYIIFFLYNPDSNSSEIGKLVHSNCSYSTLINSSCLNFSLGFPIKKVVHKITNCGVEIYWTDNNNPRRYLDLENLPYKENIEGCEPNSSLEIDCNKLNIQPDLSIPNITYTEVSDSGNIVAGAYQFAIQYSNSLGEGYTSYFSVTNPISIYDERIDNNFNYTTGKSISLSIDSIDVTGIFDYYNLAVIKTVNNITSVELVGTYNITRSSDVILYTGISKEDIKLSIEDIFFKTEIYDKANDVTTVSDIIVWSELTSSQRINYQQIANNVRLRWQTFKLPKDAMKDPLLASKYRGYMRDEVYPFELVFLLKKGGQTDRFLISSRKATPFDLEAISNSDVIDLNEEKCEPNAEQPQPRWKVYNTAFSQSKQIDTDDPCYIGPYEEGEFAYWESTEKYPCDKEIWGELADTPLRFHKFPDNVISHIHNNSSCIFPLGIKVDVLSIWDSIQHSNLTQEQKDNIAGFKIVRGNRAKHKSVVAKGLISNVGQYEKDGETYFFPNYMYNDVRPDPYLAYKKTDDDSGINTELRLNAFSTNDSKRRFSMHSPDTSFYQPFLGQILKLETIEYGYSKGNFVEVKEHAKYKFIAGASYVTALAVGIAISLIPVGGQAGLGGVGVDFAGPQAGFIAFTTVLDIINRIIPRKNFAYQYDSIGDYNLFSPVQNTGNKQRRVDLAQYISPGMLGIGDEHPINNYQREKSVYLRTTTTLPFTHETIGIPIDQSKWVLADNNMKNEVRKTSISSYYASLKKISLDQYGRLYSYESVDTGFQYKFENTNQTSQNVFGGDVFINRFSYKSKLPLFIDNRVKAPDDSDVFYDEIGNVGYPIFWMSTDVRTYDTDSGIFGRVKEVLGIKVNNFDDRSDKFFYQNGKFYLNVYGIPYFYCESEVNVDARQASNDKEGDFYPRVSSDIPHDWLQEIHVPIIQDNTYVYNKSFSKQNKENLFTYYPDNLDNSVCTYFYPNRAIFSEAQQEFSGKLRNNWLVYKPASIFDFPLNYGKLISMDGIDNRQVLVRFENKSLMYNALVTTNTSVGQVFLGQSIFNKGVPPLDFADTDLGYVGSQHKFLLKTEFGPVTIDSERGQIFVLNGQKAINIGENAEQFLTDALDFKIRNAFPTIDIDNHFAGIGLHGVYDSKYDRLIFTKLDYELVESKQVSFNNQTFKFTNESGNDILLSNTDYFKNRSFTFSYSFPIQNWVSFHSYIPNYYIGSSNYFYTGRQNGLWRHNTNKVSFGKFYNELGDYIIEYPYSYNISNEILKNVEDYSQIIKYNSDGSYIEDDSTYFTKSLIYNNQQCSGYLKLSKKPKNSLSQYMKYPKYNSDNKEILYTKVNNAYRYNDFNDMVVDKNTPIFKYENDSIFKQLDQSNINYTKKSYQTWNIQARDLKIRHILNHTDAFKFISKFIIAPTQQSSL